MDSIEIDVSRLGFGTGSLHHVFSAEARQALLGTAFEAGITHFDTAPYYGYGLAERDLGRFIRLRRSAVSLATKVGLYPWGPASAHAISVWSRKILGKISPAVSLPVVNWEVRRARLSLRESLRRLNTEYVDFLFLHEPDFKALDTDEIQNWLEWERKEGNIRAWGVAGTRIRVAPWVLSEHPLAAVVQTKDSLDLREADFLVEAGRRLQFTYGYLSGHRAYELRDPVADIMKGALKRNTSGTILVSTRRAEHLNEFAKVTECAK